MTHVGYGMMGYKDKRSGSISSGDGMGSKASARSAR